MNSADHIDNNRPRGELRFELRYSVAKPSVLISLVVNILRDTPGTNDIAGSDDFNEGGETEGINNAED